MAEGREPMGTHANVSEEECRRGRGMPGGRKSGSDHTGERLHGNRPRLGFQGGQTPFYLVIPKYRHNKGCGFRSQYKPLRPNRHQNLIYLGRADPTQPNYLTQLIKARGIRVQPLKRAYGAQLVEEMVCFGLIQDG